MPEAVQKMAYLAVFFFAGLEARLGFFQSIGGSTIIARRNASRGGNGHCRSVSFLDLLMADSCYHRMGLEKPKFTAISGGRKSQNDWFPPNLACTSKILVSQFV